MLDQVLELNGLMEFRHVGSRVTCDPPVMDTDDDVLILVKNEAEFTAAAKALWFTSRNENGISGVPLFTSLKREELNLIITENAGFYRRFLAASHVAKRLNLLEKRDRILVFQAVLYGAEYD